MLTEAEPQHMELAAIHRPARDADGLLTPKIRLPAFLRDCLPYLYLTAGFAAFFATLYITDWFWILPHYILFTGAALHLAFVLWRRRRMNANGGRNRSETTSSQD